MSIPQRYSIDTNCSPIPEKSGEWIKAEEYEELEAHTADLEREITELEEKCSQLQDKIDRAKFELD